MKDPEFSTVTFMDCLTSALGAFLLILLMMSMLAQQGMRSAPPVRDGVYAEVILMDPAEPYDVQAEVNGLGKWTRTPRHGAVERGVAVSLAPEGNVEVVFRLVPAAGTERIRNLARAPEFAVLAAPGIFGAAVRDEVKEFQRWMKLLQVDAALPPGATLEMREAFRRWFEYIVEHRADQRLSEMVLSRSERFAVAVEPLFSESVSHEKAAERVRVRYRLMGPSTESVRATIDLAPTREGIRLHQAPGAAAWRVEKIMLTEQPNAAGAR